MDSNLIRTQFYQFGRHMHTVAIATVLSLIPPIAPVAGIVALVFIFLALGDIKNLNYQIKNPNLELFRSKYISSFVTIIFAIILLVAGAVTLALSFIFPPYVLIFNAIILPISIVLLVLGFILLISASVIEMRAWENLKIFFQQNKELVPDALRHEVIDGCDNLRTGALLYALGFLVITVFIGFIFKAVGYFKLAKMNTILYQEPSKPQPVQYQVQYQQPVAQDSQPNLPKEQVVAKSVEMSNFCPNCGAKLSRGGRFCPLCGSEIN